VAINVDSYTGQEPEVSIQGIPSNTFYLVNRQQPDSEHRFWLSMRDCNTLGCYQAYLKQYPKGRYSTQAQGHLQTLQQIVESPPALPKKEKTEAIQDEKTSQINHYFSVFWQALTAYSEEHFFEIIWALIVSVIIGGWLGITAFKEGKTTVYIISYMSIIIIFYMLLVLITIPVMGVLINLIDDAVFFLAGDFISKSIRKGINVVITMSIYMSIIMLLFLFIDEKHRKIRMPKIKSIIDGVKLGGLVGAVIGLGIVIIIPLIKYLDDLIF
jgi:ABC-type proline/glycine betaine transport system permease subunit